MLKSSFVFPDQIKKEWGKQFAQIFEAFVSLTPISRIVFFFCLKGMPDDCTVVAIHITGKDAKDMMGAVHQ
jgi:hypothetical protein